MNTSHNRYNPWLLISGGIFIFVIGILIGLVVLGWWLWPVQWLDASPANLRTEYQEDHLRSAIDSYAYNPVDELAQFRFNALGDNAPVILDSIQSDPAYQEAETIQTFSNAIAAQPQPESGEVSSKPGIAESAQRAIGILLIALLLLLGVGSLVIFWVQSRETTQPEGISRLETSDEWVTETPEFIETSETTIPDEVEDIDQEGLDQEILLAESAIKTQVPDSEWKLDESDRPLGMAASGIALAAAAGAIAASDDESSNIDDTIHAETAEAKDVIIPISDTSTETWVEEQIPEDIMSKSDSIEESGHIIEDELEKITHPLQYIEGIGQVYSERLKGVGITTARDLLDMGRTRAGRGRIAEQAQISEKLVLKWVNHLDLMRITGVGSEYADLLEAAGVDTVVELSQRVPANLYHALILTNEQKSLVRQLPRLDQVEDWVNQAKELPRVVNY